MGCHGNLLLPWMSKGMSVSCWGTVTRLQPNFASLHCSRFTLHIMYYLSCFLWMYLQVWPCRWSTGCWYWHARGYKACVVVSPRNYTWPWPNIWRLENTTLHLSWKLRSWISYVHLWWWLERCLLNFLAICSSRRWMLPLIQQESEYQIHVIVEVSLHLQGSILTRLET